ncbi:MAG: DUF1934 domain-containing protein [Eubacterium sp.]|nr:DUF1934 domain-containing protein [Eubacterium sp.]
MREEVKIRIHGMHNMDEGDAEPIEILTMGEKYEEDGFLCVEYEEAIDETESGVVEVGNNLLKIKDDQVEIIKDGQIASHMVFVPGQTTVTYYSTPFGEMEVGIHTDKISKTPNDRGFDLQINYNLEMNQAFVSYCQVNVSIE